MEKLRGNIWSNYINFDWLDMQKYYWTKYIMSCFYKLKQECSYQIEYKKMLDGKPSLKGCIYMYTLCMQYCKIQNHQKSKYISLGRVNLYKEITYLSIKVTLTDSYRWLLYTGLTACILKHLSFLIKNYTVTHKIIFAKLSFQLMSLISFQKISISNNIFLYNLKNTISYGNNSTRQKFNIS